MTSEAQPEAPTKPEAAKESPAKPRFWPVAGYAFMLLMMFSVTGLKWLLGENNQKFGALSFGMILRHFLLQAALAALLAGGYLAAYRMLAARPGAWRLLRNSIVCWTALCGAVMLFDKSTLSDHIVAVRLTLRGPVLFVDEYRDWLILAGGPLLALAPKLADSFGRILRFFAKLFSPLPLILLVSFTTVPQRTVEYQEPPPAPAPPQRPAPVLLIVMDSLDKARTTDQRDLMARFPNLHSLIATATMFETTLTPGLHTDRAMPAILFQQTGTVWNADLSVEIPAEGGLTPASSVPTFYDIVGRDGDFRVLIGFHLDFTALVGGRVDWLRTLNDNYAHPWEGLAWNLRSHVHMVAYPAIVPFLSRTDYVAKFYNDRWHKLCTDVHGSLLLAVREYGPSLVGVFHVVMPHRPFIYSRDGLRDMSEDVPEDEGYLLNLEFGDRQLGEVFSELRNRNLWEDATIIVTGDHGYPWGDPTRFPPIIIKLPRQSQPRIETEPLNTADIARWLHQQPEFTKLRPPRK